MHGRAEPLKLMLSHSKVEFEELLVSAEDWNARKASGQVGGLPIVYYKGEELQQTKAIMRSFGIRLGFYDPADEASAYLNDFWFEVWEETFLNGFGNILHSEMDESEKEEATNKLLENQVEPAL